MTMVLLLGQSVWPKTLQEPFLWWTEECFYSSSHNSCIRYLYIHNHGFAQGDPIHPLSGTHVGVPSGSAASLNFILLMISWTCIRL